LLPFRKSHESLPECEFDVLEPELQSELGFGLDDLFEPEFQSELGFESDDDELQRERERDAGKKLYDIESSGASVGKTVGTNSISDGFAVGSARVGLGFG
jgi:hypothetical protein